MTTAPPGCTWCGHARHHGDCPQSILVAARPSGGNKTPTEQTACPCRFHRAGATREAQP